MSVKEHLAKKIYDRQATVSILGLGYVGLPLAVEVAKAGFSVLGVENNPKRCELVNQGKNYIKDVPDAELEHLVGAGKISASETFEVLAKADIVIICVPTPLNKNKEPDISYIVNSTFEIQKYLKKGQLIVLESTTYPGTTDEVIAAKLNQSGLKLGEDYFLAFSPERVDPGNKNFNTANTTKLVGGMTANCLELADLFYRQFVKTVVKVSSTRVAEMTKVFENVFRSVNIALVNELAQVCEKMDIDVYEVINSADTKPYGFQAFWPGPGVGGHCIPLDPYYLSWKSREYDVHTRFIELAAEINGHMPRFVVAKVGALLNDFGKSVRGARILQLGVAYKKDIDDYRESPALQVYELLRFAGAEVTVCDPWVSEFFIHQHDSTYGNHGPAVNVSALTRELMGSADLVLLATDHTNFPYEEIAENAKAIFDTRNAFGFRNIISSKIVKLSSRLKPLP